MSTQETSHYTRDNLLETLPRTIMRGGDKRTILYLYLHVADGKPLYNVYEHRLLKTLSRKHQLIVVFLVRSQNKEVIRKVVPQNAEMVVLRDFPFPERLPLLFRGFLGTVTRIIQIALLVRSLRPHLIYGNWITRSSGLYCAFASYHPFVAAASGSDILIEAKHSRVLRMLGKFTIRMADAVIVDSETQRQAVIELGCDPDKIYRFPRGIDLNRFKPRKSVTGRKHYGRSDCRIVVSTRMHFPVYGVEYLIRGIPSLLAKVRDVKFLIAGDGPLLEHHKALARELGIERNVRFLGIVPNDVVPRLLNSADVYVSTSFSDGSSVSLMEALACGLPVVATKTSGNEEWIKEGKNGFLVPPGDSLALVDRLATILQNRELRSKMGRAGLKIAKERADWNVNASVLDKCMSDLLFSRVRRS